MRPHSALGAILLGAATCLVLLPAPAVHAASGSEQSSVKRVAVGQLGGAKTQSAREWLIEGFEEESSVEVVGKDAKIKQGASEDEIASFAKEVEADAVVLGTCALKQGKGWVADVFIHNGEDGSLIEKIEVKGGAWPKYRGLMRDASLFMDAVQKARLAPEPEPEPELEEEELEQEEELEEEKSEPSEAKGRPSPLYLRAGVRLYSRSFRYTDTLNDVFPGEGYPEMLTYNLSAAPMLFGRADWYPLAHFQGGFPAHIGISGGYELGIATDVQFGNEFIEQSHSIWYVGPRIRLPVAAHELALFGSFGSHNFAIHGDERMTTDGRPAFPDVTYRFFDIGADARLLFDQLRLGAHAKYRMLLGYGDIATDGWFPNTAGRGLSVGAEVGWQLSDVFELLVGVDMLQYGLAFNPATSAANDRVAGGATDRFLSAWFALGVTLPGDPPANASGSVSISTGSGDDNDDFDDFD